MEDSRAKGQENFRMDSRFTIALFQDLKTRNNIDLFCKRLQTFLLQILKIDKFQCIEDLNNEHLNKETI